MIPARPSPDQPDPNVRRKNRRFLALALLVGVVSSAAFGAILWLLNR
jgi:hypothetical protein